jgi:hypothetical protein
MLADVVGQAVEDRSSWCSSTEQGRQHTRVFSNNCASTAPAHLAGFCQARSSSGITACATSAAAMRYAALFAVVDF